jgi:outer membrane lipoprotein SlyB
VAPTAFTGRIFGVLNTVRAAGTLLGMLLGSLLAATVTPARIVLLAGIPPAVAGAAVLARVGTEGTRRDSPCGPAEAA